MEAMKNIHASELKPDISLEEAEKLFDPHRTPTRELMDRACRLREERFGTRIHLCSIVNAKSGACTEDCAFCSQSRHHRTGTDVYPLITVEKALLEAARADENGARCFGLVTSGRSLMERKEQRQILRIVESIRSRTRLEVGGSLGLVKPAFLKELRAAGLNTLHHNLETAESFYSEICTTHPFEDRLRTIRDAQDIGLQVCSGAILGLGESHRQRAELALLLRRIRVDRVPVNFLNPIPGTALQKQARMPPLEALHSLAAMRLLIPEQDLLMCGGREVVLRSLQPLLFLAGANGMMTGNYLTTAGQGQDKDKGMIEDLGLEWGSAAV